MKLVSEVVFLAMHLSGTLFQICSLTQRNSSSVWSNLSLNLHESYFVIEESWEKTYRWKLSQMATILKVFFIMFRLTIQELLSHIILEWCIGSRETLALRGQLNYSYQSPCIDRHWRIVIILIKKMFIITNFQHTLTLMHTCLLILF